MSGPVDLPVAPVPGVLSWRGHRVRIARVLLVIALAFMVISFVMGIGTPSRGLLEKAVLLALIGGGVYAAAKVSTLSDRVVHRLEH